MDAVNIRAFQYCSLVRQVLFIFVVWSIAISFSVCLAEEQNIVESFGLYSKGIEYYHKGNLSEAKAVLERSIKLDPRNEEAAGYLDLVNAEIKMREKGNLGFYQDSRNLNRESDMRPSGPENEPEIPGYYESEEEELLTDSDMKEVSRAIINGEYKMSFGMTSKDTIWNKANGDYNERNFRMIDHHFQKTNTFDTRVYDRFKVVFDTNKEGYGVNLHSDITMDPWSFVGKTKKLTATSSWGDVSEIQLKYWGGTNGTINETFYSSKLGNSFAMPEVEVKHGKTIQTNITGASVNEFDLSDTFTVPEGKIDYTFQPIRELWIDANGEGYKIRVFPLGLEDQALSSDDPLGLSNHHIYWEPSPWLDDWLPGHENTGATPVDFSRGEWSDDLSFFTRDSELKRITALRGFSLSADLFDNTNFSTTVAAPKTLWQDYDSVTSVPGAVRTKTQMTDSLILGTIDTFRVGYYKGKVDSYNNVFGLDINYDIGAATNIAGEVAVSKSENDRRSVYKTSRNGSLGHMAIKTDTAVGNLRVAFTHMDSSFDPGLANYKETKRDQSWGRHIHFKKPLEYTAWASPTLKYDDIDPFRIGDGIDTGRNVINCRLKTEDMLDKKMANLIDFRYVRDTDHKFVEGVIREENTFNFMPEWTSKALLLYHDLPKTKAGIDPILYDADTGEYLKNTAISDGKEARLSTYSFGLQYEPEEWISIFGIYENTNDYRFSTGNHPNGLLNSTYFTTVTEYGRTIRKEVPQLYSQGYFDLPPFNRFNIYRAGISLRPSEILGVDFDYTKNDFKFAAGIDDNMNHFSTTLRYKFSARLTGFLKHTFSRSYNLYRLNTGGGLKYQGHHNIFAELDYSITDDGFLVIQFGEGSVLSPVWGPTASPFGDFYPTLDTQHIVRVYYNGRF